MQEASGRTTPGWGLRIASQVGVSLVCIGVCAGNTFAQAPQGDPAAKAGLQKKPAAAVDAGKADNVPSKATPGSERPVRPAVLAKGKPQRTNPKKLTSAKRNAHKKSNMGTNPNAKWACDKQAVSLEPIWRSHEQLSFAFNIRNEGTEDLKIKAKGG